MASDSSKNSSEGPDNVDPSTANNKIKRRSFSYEEKLRIIKLLDKQSKRDICKQLNLDETTFNKWMKQSKKFEVICQNNYAKNLKRHRISDITEVDDMLYTWFLKERAKGIILSGPILKARARAISEELGIRNFKASEHWFCNWKKRKDVRLKMQGEKISADEFEAISYEQYLEEIISREQLTRAQVFNIDDSLLNYEMLPVYTTVSGNGRRAPGFKKDKSCVTLAKCSNADGSLKIPILIIGPSANPRGLKSRSNQKSPVFYTHPKTSLMTSSIFKNWFEREFAPRVQIFLREKGLPIRAVLLLDNCRSHEISRVGDIRTELLPPNVTSIALSMDQGILETLLKN